MLRYYFISEIHSHTETRDVSRVTATALRKCFDKQTIQRDRFERPVRTDVRGWRVAGCDITYKTFLVRHFISEF